MIRYYITEKMGDGSFLCPYRSACDDIVGAGASIHPILNTTKLMCEVIAAEDAQGRDGGAVAPTSMSYRVDCLTNDDEVMEDAAVTPGASIEIELTPEVNEIIGPTNSRGLRIVTITANYGDGEQITDDYKYYVVDKAKYSSPI